MPKPVLSGAAVRNQSPAARRNPAPSVSFPQREGASLKLGLLFDMARARTALLAAIQGLLPGSAERPHADGKWNTRQYVLHLAYWDQVFAADIEPALRGVAPGWAANEPAADDRLNAAALEQMDHLTWDEALRLLHGARKHLLATIEGLPEAAAIWEENHPLGGILRSVARHDRHHADAIKRWRIEQNA